MKQYYVYIMASWSRVLYVGVAGDLERRVTEHRNGILPGFTKQYNVTRLVYYEVHEQARHAIEREKRIKAWRRDKKIALIESMNPAWDDLAALWFRE
jgi:putative endonuclease